LTDEQYESLARTFSALSNPGRLKVLALLANVKEPVTNNTVMMLLQLNQSQTSNYLKELSDAGFVKRQPSGNYVLHSVNDAGLDKLVFVLLNLKKEPKVITR
jgi:DNA-binding transcriptional ArsR family regulator